MCVGSVLGSWACPALSLFTNTVSRPCGTGAVGRVLALSQHSTALSLHPPQGHSRRLLSPRSSPLPRDHWEGLARHCTASAHHVLCWPGTKLVDGPHGPCGMAQGTFRCQTWRHKLSLWRARGFGPGVGSVGWGQTTDTVGNLSSAVHWQDD